MLASHLDVYKYTLNSFIIIILSLKFPSTNASYIFFDGLPVQKFIDYTDQFGRKTQNWPETAHNVSAGDGGRLKDSSDYHRTMANASGFGSATGLISYPKQKDSKLNKNKLNFQFQTRVHSSFHFF